MTDRVEYRCIVADPPWPYYPRSTDVIHRARNPYPTMPLDDIKALPVASWAATDAHLYLWVTNSFMVEGHEVARAWGFEPRTIVTWVKDKIGLGTFFRNSTEHVLFCVRGKLPVLRRDMPTHFTAPRRAHSEKPDGLLWVAEQMTPGPRLEMFARRRRDGWDVWGDEAPDISQMLLERSA